MKQKYRRVFVLIHASAENIVDYQRDKGFTDHPITIMALAIASICRWGLEELEKEEAPEDHR
jgi:hypothetical protein